MLALITLLSHLRAQNAGCRNTAEVDFSPALNEQNTSKNKGEEGKTIIWTPRESPAECKPTDPWFPIDHQAGFSVKLGWHGRWARVW